MKISYNCDHHNDHIYEGASDLHGGFYDHASSFDHNTHSLPNGYARNYGNFDKYARSFDRVLHRVLYSEHRDH